MLWATRPGLCGDMRNGGQNISWFDRLGPELRRACLDKRIKWKCPKKSGYLSRLRHGEMDSRN